MSDPIGDLVEWQLSQQPPTGGSVSTTCHVCGTSWDAEVAQCPNGCAWEPDPLDVADGEWYAQANDLT